MISPLPALARSLALFASKVPPKLYCAALMGVSLSCSAFTPGELEALRLFAGKVKSEYGRIQNAARATVVSEIGAAGCNEYAALEGRNVAEYRLFARLSSDIYQSDMDERMKASGITSQNFLTPDGKAVTGFRDQLSDGYAEIHHDALANTKVIVFRGTKVLSLKDIATNLVQFSNVLPERYRWADDLVAHVHAESRGHRLLITGHSLGGGLAMYAGLRHQARTVVFNPAGLSRGVLNELALSRSQWETANSKVLAFVARSGKSIEPVSALSFAGETVIAGRRYIIDLPPNLTPIQQHDMARLAEQLEDPAGLPVSCTNDVGFQRLRS